MRYSERNVDVGVTLHAARTRAGLSQAELARRAGTSQATVSAYESGSKQPSVATFSRLLAAAGARLTVESLRRALGEGSGAHVAPALGRRARPRRRDARRGDRARRGAARAACAQAALPADRPGRVTLPQKLVAL